ncbi:MAG: HAD hydrolase-like protein [Methyloceanibacter sp.]|nr:HAD hydrolase-like protein [Methyloceanibacter sp.]
MILSDYRTLIFDCDGVVLNSNRIKTAAFYETARPFGDDAARNLVDYHLRNGGVSRYRKLEYFLTDILGKRSRAELSSLLDSYASFVKNALLDCEVTPGLDHLRTATAKAKWMIVSGSDEAELREVFRLRGLDRYFDAGIYGSPRQKSQIFSELVRDDELIQPAIYFGDSKYDHISSKDKGIDFIFISGWSEFEGWEAYCEEHRLSHFIRVQDLA